MSVKNKVWHLFTALLILGLLAGCSAAPTAAPTYTPYPTVDLQPTFDAIAAGAAATVIADLTKNAPTATPVTPTATATMTATPAPTDTPAPTATATRVFIAWTKTPTAEPAAYACAITGVSPSSTNKITVDTEFDAKWSLKNTGSETWRADSVDIKYSSGDKLQTSGDLVDMKSDIAPNGTYTVTVDMKAPSSDGTYTTTWILARSEGTFCTLSLTINVSK